MSGYSFHEDSVELAQLFRSLAHPARIEILKIMLDKGGKVEAERIEIPQVSVFAMDRHLRDLKKAGIIHGRLSGKNCKFWLNEEMILKIEEILENNLEELRVFRESVQKDGEQ